MEGAAVKHALDVCVVNNRHQNNRGEKAYNENYT